MVALVCRAGCLGQVSSVMEEVVLEVAPAHAPSTPPAAAAPEPSCAVLS